jgi:hypothetical protein
LRRSEANDTRSEHQGSTGYSHGSLKALDMRR